MPEIYVDNHTIPLKHLEKFYFPDEGITKADILDYYITAAPYLLPHIENKPFSMIHFPHGLGGGQKSFYQKQRPGDAPEWLRSVELPSGNERGAVDWCLVNDTASVLYMVNRGVPEMHTWFSRLPDLGRPDLAVLDLDPSEGSDFNDVKKIALFFQKILEELRLKAFPKLSGGSGLHIYIPIEPRPFPEVQRFLLSLCEIVIKEYPALATTERLTAKRGTRIYLDAIQNARGKTIAAPYSVRVKPGAPVAVPLHWDELKSRALKPATYTLNNGKARLESEGDLMAGIYELKQKL
ncbi:DNA polymerase domain-containing protein [Clostridia bacterium]|nr:DNA polymerase domain-containing protein [Clostridia bacterium]